MIRTVVWLLRWCRDQRRPLVTEERLAEADAWADDIGRKLGLDADKGISCSDVRSRKGYHEPRYDDRGWHCEFCGALLRLGVWYPAPAHSDGLGGSGQ